MRALYTFVLLPAPTPTIFLRIVGNLSSIALSVVTRTVGIPHFGPHAGEVADVGTIALVSRLVELLLIIVLGVLLRTIQSSPRPRPQRNPAIISEC